MFKVEIVIREEDFESFLNLVDLWQYAVSESYRCRVRGYLNTPRSTAQRTWELVFVCSSPGEALRDIRRKVEGRVSILDIDIVRLEFPELTHPRL